MSTALLFQYFKSLTCDQASLSSLTACCHESLSLSRDTPSIAKFLSLNSPKAFTTFGFSALHGPHQLAQKSTSTYFPLKEANEIIFPSASGKFNSGACCPTHEDDDELCC